jgi:hypothetical protein
MTGATTHELLDQEQRFWQAMQDKDPDATGGMTDDQSIVVGAQGASTINPAQMSKMTSEGKWQLKKFEIDGKSAQVRMLTDDIALVAYHVTEQVTVDGQDLAIEANDASVWVRRGGAWRCALHTESLAGDPFGRDRKSAEP